MLAEFQIKILHWEPHPIPALFFLQIMLLFSFFQQLIQCKSEESVICSGFSTLNSPLLLCMVSNRFRGWWKVKTKIFLKQKKPKKI